MTKRGRPRTALREFKCIKCERVVSKRGARGMCPGCTSAVYAKFARDAKKQSEQKQLNIIQETDAIVEKNLLLFREQGFPYPDTVSLINDFEALQKSESKDILVGHLLRWTNIGLAIANYFTKSRFEATKINCISSMKAFEDDTLCRTAISYVLKKKQKQKHKLVLTRAQFLNALRRIHKVAFINNFRPTVAKTIYDLYCPNQGIVYDFCAGYGGRLTGAMASSKVLRYIGVEPNTKTCKELNDLDCWFREHFYCKDIKIVNGCAEEYCPTELKESVDVVLTSPPYYNAEIYCNEETQSCIRYKTYEVWLSCFLQKALENTKLLLKQNGILAINISSTGKFNLEADIVELAKQLDFKLVDIYQMQLRERSSAFGSFQFAEPIFIFQK